eukprot:128820-Pyramimonas_sp.AAC.1
MAGEQLKQEDVLKYWMDHKPSLKATLRAAATSESKHPGACCSKTLYGRAVKRQWELMNPEQQESWRAAAAAGGPPPSQPALAFTVSQGGSPPEGQGGAESRSAAPAPEARDQAGACPGAGQSQDSSSFP